jgi:glycosidase
VRLTPTSDLWWKTAVIYCLDIETYADGNGDGCGDIRGLIQNIDHLDRLGVTCLWLMPFFPTPDRDDGYDITDFYGVDGRLGSLGDMVELIRTARDRGIG